MNSQEKVDAISIIQSLSAECVTKQNRYIDHNELVCFNGAIALPYLSPAHEPDDIDFLTEEVPEELADIYDHSLTLQHINSIHYAYCNDKISIDKAKALVVRVLERFE